MYMADKARINKSRGQYLFHFNLMRPNTAKAPMKGKTINEAPPACITIETYKSGTDTRGTRTRSHQIFLPNSIVATRPMMPAAMIKDVRESVEAVVPTIKSTIATSKTPVAIFATWENVNESFISAPP